MKSVFQWEKMCHLLKKKYLIMTKTYLSVIKEQVKNFIQIQNLNQEQIN